MRLDARTYVTARGVGSVALVGVAVAATAGFARGLPDPGLMANLSNTCLQFSQDGGTIWGDVSVITLDDTFAPAPGGEYLQGDFLARNRCDAPASLQVYAGRWDVSAGAAGTWRTDLAGTAGEPVTLTGPAEEADRSVLIGETAAPRNQVVPVRLYLGIPAGETRQSYSISPGWAFSLEETGQSAVPAPPTGLTPDPQSPNTDDRVTVSGAAEPDSTVEVTVDGVVRCTTTATPAGTFSCDVGTLTRGTHQLSARATNAAGTSDPAADVPVTARVPGTGRGSLGILLGLGSLGSLGAGGSLTGESPGSLSGLGSLGSDQGVPGHGAPDQGDPGPGGTTPGGTTPGGAAPVGGNGGNSAGSGSGNHSGSAPTAGPGGNSAADQDPGGSGAGSSGTGELSGAALGIAQQAPAAGVGHAPSGADDGAPGGADPADGPGARSRGAGLGSTGSTGSAGSTGSTASTASLGSSGSPSSVDRLIHLGGPTIRVVPE